jgi:hypothetical protein
MLVCARSRLVPPLLKGQLVMRLKTLLATGLTAVALVGVGAGVAQAGEVTGNGGPTQNPAHANSICVYSGLNDDPNAPAPEGGHVQSYGQIVRAGGKAFAPSPGDECNGHTGILATGGSE